MLITRIGFARTSGEDGIVLEKRAAFAFVPGFPPRHVTDQEIWGQQRSEERSGIGAVIEAQHLQNLLHERLKGSTYAFTRSAPKSSLEAVFSGEDGIVLEKRAAVAFVPGFPPRHVTDREIWGQQRSEERSGIGAVIEAQHLHDLPNERLQGSTYAFTRSAPMSGLEIQWSAERTESFWRSGQRSPLSPDFHLGMLPIGKSRGNSDRKNDPASERSSKLNIYMVCPMSGFKAQRMPLKDLLLRAAKGSVQRRGRNRSGEAVSVRLCPRIST